VEKRKADMCHDFCLVNSTLQNMWKNITKIISAVEQNGWRIKRFRKPERSDVDEELPNMQGGSVMKNS
jgi:Txe/YoeB family toxin of Txe-Axe toxin-antitoxin module